MCGIFGITGHKEAGKIAYLGLYALQHRGEESAGIVSHTGKRLAYQKGMGLVSDVFDEQSLRTLRGNVAIGHVRYSTTGASHVRNIQPFFVSHRKGNIVIAHNGNLTNSFELRSDMEKEGSVFQTTMDSEVLVHLLARPSGNDIASRVAKALEPLKGAYSFLIMLDSTLVGARDPHGWRPLCIGKLDGAYLLSSETCAFDLINAEYVRDVEPGEIVVIENNKLTSIKPFKKEKRSYCIFEHIYFARPDSNVFGKNVYRSRKSLGEHLAKEHPAKGDMVMPIPDSGNYAALGFAKRSKLPFEVGMIRNHYIGRTFIQPSQFIRDFRVKVKLNPIKEILKDKEIVVVEDSIVRGTTSKSRVKTLRDAGAKKIHMRVSCPPIKYPCFYGIDFPTKRELIASKCTVSQVKDYIGLDSLKYLSVKSMLKSMALPGKDFCTACFTGEYPAKVPKKISKKILEKDG